jgi:hypothetical protein
MPKKKQKTQDANNIQKVREAVKRAHDQIDDDMDRAARVDRAFNRELPFMLDEVHVYVDGFRKVQS